MKIFFLLSFLFVLYSCNNDLNTIGDSMIPANGYVEIVTQDIENSYTIRLDSFPTSINALSYLSSTQLTLGKIEDKTTGTTIATPYFQIIGNGYDSRLNFNDNYTYDSLTLNIATNYQALTLLAGDTTSLQTFYLHRLTDYPRMDYDNPYIYNNDEFSYEKESLGRLQLRFEKNYLENSNLYFKLNDDLGRELFHLMQGKDSIFLPANAYDFIRYFNGLVIIPDENNSALLPIDASTLSLTCHYHLGTSPYSFSLPAAGNFYAFTNITHSPTPILKGVSWFQPLSFNKAQMGVIQGLDGYMLKLQLPYLPANESYKTIIKAEIELKPKLVNYENIPEPTKSYIQVFALDKFSKLTGPLSDYSGNPVYGYLQSNVNYPDERKYIIDITDYYISMVNGSGNIDPQLNLAIGLQGTPRQLGVAEIPTMVGSVATSFDRLILDDIPVLKIYYAKYK